MARTENSFKVQHPKVLIAVQVLF